MNDARELLWLRRMRDLCQALANEPDAKALLPRILDAAIELTEAERGYLVLLRGRQAERLDLKIVAARGFGETQFDPEVLKVSQRVVERVLQRDELGVVTTNTDQDLLDATSVRERRVLSIACVPLRLRGETRGVLYLDHRFQKDAFRPEDLPALRAFANQTALALETAELLAAPGSKPQGIEEILTRLESEQGRPQPPSPLQRFGRLVGGSPAMGAVYQEIERAARSWEPVLILGEPGTGKAEVAREIHAASARASEPFLQLDCASLDPDALTSELLGHRKGAFPWATSDRRGLFVLAGKGTLYLSGLESLPFRVQGKLARVLSEERVTQVGGAKPTPLSCRLLVSSREDLASRVEEGSFRADLYYRLDVLRIVVPPLRQRPGDVPLLIEHFAQARGFPRLGLSERALQLLSKHAWPGNVRELENEVQRLAALGASRLSARQLSQPIRDGTGVGVSPAANASYAGKTLSQVEQEMLALALESAGGNKSHAARQLGIPRSTLYHLLERYGLS